MRDLADAVHMARDDVPTQAVVRAQGFFEVDGPGLVEPRRARQRFGRDVDGEAAGGGIDLRGRHARTIERDAVAQAHVIQIAGGRLDQQLLAMRAAVAQCPHFNDAANRGDDAREHEKTPQIKDLRGFSKKVARLAGFEPTTPWFVAKYSIQLSYSRAKPAILTQEIW